MIYVCSVYVRLRLIESYTSSANKLNCYNFEKIGRKSVDFIPMRLSFMCVCASFSSFAQFYSGVCADKANGNWIKKERNTKKMRGEERITTANS